MSLDLFGFHLFEHKMIREFITVRLTCVLNDDNVLYSILNEVVKVLLQILLVPLKVSIGQNCEDISVLRLLVEDIGV
jgi:hypothetical protein